MADNGVLKQNVYAFQIHQEKIGEEGEIDIVYQEKNFPIGSALSFPVQSAAPSLQPSEEDWQLQINPASFHIGTGSQLSIDTVSIDPSSDSGKNSSLFISTDSNPDYMCICPYLSSQKGNTLVTNLGVKIIGPAVVNLALVDHYDKSDNDTDQGFHCVNVFGHVQYVSSDIQQLVDNAKTAVTVDDVDEVEVDNEVDDIEDGSDEIVDTMQKVSKEKEIAKKTSKESKETAPSKRKLSNLDEPTEDADIKIAKTSSEPAKLSKKQRKQLAKKKEKELLDVVAKENEHASKASNKADANKKQKSLTRPRMIKGGILIQDIIHGDGASCKIGRKVSINYVGTFLDGKVFDKNQSKSKPLTFRLGTGEVIKGLDRGLEGMKVNGERIITIPSEMGYGSKGSGNIPGDTKLIFSVHVKSVGSK